MARYRSGGKWHRSPLASRGRLGPTGPSVEPHQGVAEVYLLRPVDKGRHRSVCVNAPNTGIVPHFFNAIDLAVRQ